jgi:hypothetical protein
MRKPFIYSREFFAGFAFMALFLVFVLVIMGL